MNYFPDFSAHGYQVIEQLGKNIQGGRVTYLAKAIVQKAKKDFDGKTTIGLDGKPVVLVEKGELVVIKQFQFTTGAGWDGFDEIKREIDVLQGLKHNGIPFYIEWLESDDCLVTQYFKAKTLESTRRSFDAGEVKRIIVQLLEILVYLQQRVPPIFHRDLKPDNILIDDYLNVRLIDFGIARIGGGTVSVNSVAGAFGFMAPEQVRNLKLTKASDLYSLGMTLICLLGKIDSGTIGEYVDARNQLDQEKIIKKLSGYSLRFIDWLNKLVEPDPKDRYPDAETALEALKPLYVVRVPEVKFFKDGEGFDPIRTPIAFKATKLGEKVSQTIRLVNPIPETELEGYWEIAHHSNDGDYETEDHPWISFSSKKFRGNSVSVTIKVDTSKLIAEAIGKRELVLNLNTTEGKYNVPIKLETALLPLPSQKFAKSFVIKSITNIIVSIILPIAIAILLSFLRDDGIGSMISGIVCGALFFFASFYDKHNLNSGVKFFSWIIIIVVAMLLYITKFTLYDALIRITGWISGCFLGRILAFNLINYRNKPLLWIKSLLIKNKKDFSILLTIFGVSLGLRFLILVDINSFVYKLLTIPFVCSYIGCSTRSSIITDFTNYFLKPIDFYILLITVSTGSWLGYIFFYPYLKRQFQIQSYRRKEEHLIKP